MKLFKGFSLFSLSYGTFTPDTDGTCQLLDATCDHNGFHITFDMNCRDQDYRGIAISELYANGWTQASTLATYGAENTAPAECKFTQDTTDTTKYKMDFNYRQCGTDHPDSDTDNLIYRNAIQAQEYNGDIIMGAKLRFEITCSGNRIAEITTQTGDISGDTDHDASKSENRPGTWIDEILSLSIYTDNTYSTAMQGANMIPFGDNIYADITAQDSNEAIFTRITDCWATSDSDPTSTPKFDLISNNCATEDWINLTPANNGASATSRFDFRSFRFPNQLTFHLHCAIYLCHDDQLDCIKTCNRRKRRMAPEETSPALLTESGEQDNGLPIPQILSTELIITDAPLSDNQKENIGKTFKALENRAAKLRKAAKGLSLPIRRLRNELDF